MRQKNLAIKIVHCKLLEIGKRKFDYSICVKDLAGHIKWFYIHKYIFNNAESVFDSTDDLVLVVCMDRILDVYTYEFLDHRYNFYY